MKRMKAIPVLFLGLLLILGGCEESPTTLVVSVSYDDGETGTPPATSYLYLRLMLQDGTVVWSNEAAPYVISDLAHGDTFRYVFTPDDSILTDPADLYMFDAYFYDTDLSPAAIDPTDPAGTGDAERFTLEATPSGATPIYDRAPHLLTGIEIHSGDQKHLHLVAEHDFP